MDILSVRFSCNSIVPIYLYLTFVLINYIVHKDNAKQYGRGIHMVKSIVGICRYRYKRKKRDCNN